MTRLALALVVFLGFLVPAALGTLSPYKEPRLGKNLPPKVHQEKSSTTDGKADFRITEKTEVKLDGKPCKYEEVPGDAEIIHLEIKSAQDKEILKIHFRTKK